MRQLHIDPKVIANQAGHTLDVDLTVYTQTAIDQRRDAANKLESALRELNVAVCSRQNGRTRKLLKYGAGDGTRTHDVQLGKLAFYH